MQKCNPFAAADRRWPPLCPSRARFSWARRRFSGGVLCKPFAFWYDTVKKQLYRRPHLYQEVLRMTTARDPQKKKRAPSKGRVFLWAGVFLLNFVLLTAAVSLAVFPQAGPLTAERLARLPYFEGCELLDVHTRAGGSARLFGQSDADWVLYRNSAGETRLVGVSWSLYTSRFRIDEKTDAAVPGDRLYHTAQVQSGSGLYEVSVQTQDRIMDARCIAGMQAPQSSVWLYISLALGLTLLEAAVPLFIQRRRKRRP